jgi:glucose/arabinose dehydrogenase
MDFAAAQLKSGISQIRAFDIGNLPDGRPYDYPSEGRLMGWGLRNSVGVAEHPVTGGIYSGKPFAYYCLVAMHLTKIF